MKIWHIYVSNQSGPVNGVVQAGHRLAAAQRRAGHDVQILWGTDADPTRTDAAGSVRGLGRQLDQIGSGVPPDLVHVHELFRPPHLRAASLLRDVPYVISTHGALAPLNLARARIRKAAYGVAVERRLLERAAALVAQTPAEERDIRGYLPAPPPIARVGNLADDALLERPNWAYPDGTPTLVSLGHTDVHHRGLDRMADLACRLPATRFHVYGSPTTPEPRRLARFLEERPSNLTLEPSVSGAEREQHLASAHGFAFLSRWCEVSIGLLDAMARGVPCFVSPEVSRALDDRSTHVVVPADPAEGAEVIATNLADVARMEAVGAAGRRWVRRNASPAAVVAATDQLYFRVTGHRRTPRRAATG